MCDELVEQLLVAKEQETRLTAVQLLAEEVQSENFDAIEWQKAGLFTSICQAIVAPNSVCELFVEVAADLIKALGKDKPVAIDYMIQLVEARLLRSFEQTPRQSHPPFLLLLAALAEDSTPHTIDELLVFFVGYFTKKLSSEQPAGSNFSSTVQQSTSLSSLSILNAASPARTRSGSVQGRRTSMEHLTSLSVPVVPKLELGVDRRERSTLYKRSSIDVNGPMRESLMFAAMKAAKQERGENPGTPRSFSKSKTMPAVRAIVTCGHKVGQLYATLDVKTLLGMKKEHEALSSANQTSKKEGGEGGEIETEIIITAPEKESEEPFAFSRPVDTLFQKVLSEFEVEGDPLYIAARMVVVFFRFFCGTAHVTGPVGEDYHRLFTHEISAAVDRKDVDYLSLLCMTLRQQSIWQEALLFRFFRQPTSLVGYPTDPIGCYVPLDIFLRQWSTIVSYLMIQSPVDWETVVWFLCLLAHYVEETKPTAKSLLLQCASACFPVLTVVLDTIRMSFSFSIQCALVLHYCLEVFDAVLASPVAPPLLLRVFEALFLGSDGITGVSFFREYARMLLADHYAVFGLRRPQEVNVVVEAEGLESTLFWPRDFDPKAHLIRILRHYKLLATIHTGDAGYRRKYTLPLDSNQSSDTIFDFLLNPFEGAALGILATPVNNNTFQIYIEVLDLIRVAAFHQQSPILARPAWVATYTRFLYLSFLISYNSAQFTSEDPVTLKLTTMTLSALSAIVQSSQHARLKAEQLGIVHTLTHEVDLEHTVTSLRERHIRRSTAATTFSSERRSDEGESLNQTVKAMTFSSSTEKYLTVTPRTPLHQRRTSPLGLPTLDLSTSDASPTHSPVTSPSNKKPMMLTIPKLSLASVPPPLYYTSNGDTAAAMENIGPSPLIPDEEIPPFPVNEDGEDNGQGTEEEEEGGSSSPEPLEEEEDEEEIDEEEAEENLEDAADGIQEEEEEEDRTALVRTAETTAPGFQEESERKKGNSECDDEEDLPSTTEETETDASKSPTGASLQNTPPPKSILVTTDTRLPPESIPKLALGSAPPPTYFTSSGHSGTPQSPTEESSGTLSLFSRRKESGSMGSAGPVSPPQSGVDPKRAFSLSQSGSFGGHIPGAGERNFSLSSEGEATRSNSMAFRGGSFMIDQVTYPQSLLQNEGRFTAHQRSIRRIYVDIDVQAEILFLLLQLIVRRNGSLEENYLDSYNFLSKKVNILFYVETHLNHPSNKNVVPRLRKKVMSSPNRGLRVLFQLLVTRQNFQETWNSSSRIGRGAFGAVLDCGFMLGGKGGHKDLAELSGHAVKIIPVPKQIEDRANVVSLHTEVLIMIENRDLGGVCELVDFGNEGGTSYRLVMKRYATSVSEWRQSIAEEEVSVAQTHEEYLPIFMRIFLDVLTTVEKLHLRNIAHYDLKCDNIFMDVHPSSQGPSTVDLRVGDFGESEIIDRDDDTMYNSSVRASERSVRRQKVRGTELNRAPEIILPARFLDDRRRKLYQLGFQSDVWSLGCFLYELITGKFLFEEGREHYAAVVHRLTSEDDDLLEDVHRLALNNDSQLINLLSFILVRDPNRRPLIGEVRQKVLETVKANKMVLRQPEVRKDPLCSPQLSSLSPTAAKRPMLHSILFDAPSEFLDASEIMQSLEHQQPSPSGLNSREQSFCDFVLPQLLFVDSIPRVEELYEVGCTHAITFADIPGCADHFPCLSLKHELIGVASQAENESTDAPNDQQPEAIFCRALVQKCVPFIQNVVVLSGRCVIPSFTSGEVDIGVVVALLYVTVTYNVPLIASMTHMQQACEHLGPFTKLTACVRFASVCLRLSRALGSIPPQDYVTMIERPLVGLMASVAHMPTHPLTAILNKVEQSQTWRAQLYQCMCGELVYETDFHRPGQTVTAHHREALFDVQRSVILPDDIIGNDSISEYYTFLSEGYNPFVLESMFPDGRVRAADLKGCRTSRGKWLPFNLLRLSFNATPKDCLGTSAGWVKVGTEWRCNLCRFPTHWESGDPSIPTVVAHTALPVFPSLHSFRLPGTAAGSPVLVPQQSQQPQTPRDQRTDPTVAADIPHSSLSPEVSRTRKATATAITIRRPEDQLLRDANADAIQSALGHIAWFDRFHLVPNRL